MPADGIVRLPDLDLRPNEASGLLRLRNDALKARLGWDRGFWVVLDEGDIAECVALIGHAAGAPLQSDWQILRLHAERDGDDGKASDAEALAEHDGWVYLFGSQHGGKSGPLRRSESWVARFREGDVRAEQGTPTVALDVRRLDLALHRLVNDALAEQGVPLAPLGPTSREAFIDQTLAQQGEHAVRSGDTTINVEGAAFRPGGTLLLGLRFPTDADGRPLLVQLAGIEGLFAPTPALPRVEGFWIVDGVGRGGGMAGVRDLTTDGDHVHLVTGNIDSHPGRSVLLADHPSGRDTISTHFVCTLPAGETGGTVPARAVREFPDLPRVEGIEIDTDGRFFYVSDEDEGVHVRCTALLAG